MCLPVLISILNQIRIYDKLLSTVSLLELYHGGAWFMVYTSGAVSIEHEGVARVFYSKQKPRVCTINHKPRHGTTVLYDTIAQGLIWARIVHVAIRLRRGATRLHNS